MPAKYLAPLLACAALFVSAPPATASEPASAARVTAKKEMRCAVPGSRTVAANRHARVFKREYGFWACSYATGRTLGLGIGAEPCSSNGCFGVRNVVLRRQYVAWEDLARDPNASTSEVYLANLNTRRVRLVWRAGDLNEQQTLLVSVTDIALSPSRRLAWIAAFGSSTTLQYTYEVHVRLGGVDHVIDSGPDIQPQSLATSWDLVYWLKAGIPQSFAPTQ